MKKFKTITLASLLLIVAGASISYIGMTRRASQRISVAATIFPLYDVTQFIADGEISVELLLPEGQTPNDLPVINARADFDRFAAVFAVGQGLDTERIPESAQSKLLVVDKGIELLLSQGSTGNPYYWLSPKNMLVITDTITAELARLDPKNANKFQKRRTLLRSQIEALDTNITDLMRQLPLKNMVVYGYDWEYFARDYGLTVVWHQPEGPILAADQDSLGTTLSKFGIRTIFSDSTIDPASLLPLVLARGVALETLDTFGGTEDRKSYTATMAYNARTIFGNLNIAAAQ